MKPMSKMQPHERRVVNEHHELTQRAERLDLFMGSAFFQQLTDAERRRLERQHTYMTLYLNVLQERIDAF